MKKGKRNSDMYTDGEKQDITNIASQKRYVILFDTMRTLTVHSYSEIVIFT